MKDSIAKVFFVLSIAVLAVAYGIGAQQYGWFPSSPARQEFLQVENIGLVKSSLYSHEAAYSRQGVRIPEPRKMQPGMTAIASWWEEPEGRRYGVKLLSRDGESLHEWWVERGELFKNTSSQRRGPLESHITSFSVLPDGELVATLSYVGLFRLNSCGEVLWTLPEGTHHSVTRAEDGSFWVSAVSQNRRSRSESYPDGYPGLGSVWVDRALHVSKKGQVLNDINLLDVIYKNN